MQITEQHWRCQEAVENVCVCGFFVLFCFCAKGREEVMSHFPSQFNVAGFTSRAPALWARPLTSLITRDFPSAAAGWLQQGLYGSCLVCAVPPRCHLRERSSRTRLWGAGGCYGDDLGPRWRQETKSSFERGNFNWQSGKTLIATM